MGCYGAGPHNPHLTEPWDNNAKVAACIQGKERAPWALKTPVYHHGLGAGWDSQPCCALLHLPVPSIASSLNPGGAARGKL